MIGDVVDTEELYNWKPVPFWKKMMRIYTQNFNIMVFDFLNSDGTLNHCYYWNAKRRPSEKGDPV